MPSTLKVIYKLIDSTTSQSPTETQPNTGTSEKPVVVRGILESEITNKHSKLLYEMPMITNNETQNHQLHRQKSKHYLVLSDTQK